MQKHVNLDELAEEVERVRAQVAASPNCGVLVSIDFARFALRWYDTLVQRAKNMAKASEVVSDAVRRVAGRRGLPTRTATVEPVYRAVPSCFTLHIAGLGDTMLDTSTGVIVAKRICSECGVRLGMSHLVGCPAADVGAPVLGWVTPGGVVYGGNDVEPFVRSRLIDAWQEAIDVARQLQASEVKA